MIGFLPNLQGPEYVTCIISVGIFKPLNMWTVFQHSFHSPFPRVFGQQIRSIELMSPCMRTTRACKIRSKKKIEQRKNGRRERSGMCNSRRRRRRRAHTKGAPASDIEHSGGGGFSTTLRGGMSTSSSTARPRRAELCRTAAAAACGIDCGTAPAEHPHRRPRRYALHTAHKRTPTIYTHTYINL